MTLTAEYATISGIVITVIGEAAKSPHIPRIPYARTKDAAVKPATNPFLTTTAPVTRKPRRKKPITNIIPTVISCGSSSAAYEALLSPAFLNAAPRYSFIPSPALP